MSKLIKIILGIIILLGIAVGLKRVISPSSIQLAYSEQHPKQATLILQSGTAFPHPRTLPSFKLTDTNNQLFSNKQLQDQWSFVFFGYTNCPGICPATLGKLNELATLLGPGSGAMAQFILISIDPKNDTPNHMKTYFSKPEFKKADFLGATGKIEDIQALAKVIGLFVSEDNIPINGHIEHSGTVLLVNPDGKLAAVFNNPNNPSVIMRDFKALMHQHHQGL